MTAKIILYAAAIALAFAALVAGGQSADVRPLLDAMRRVESGGAENPPDGDGGRAIGPYQIWRVYWLDSRVAGDWKDCRQAAYAERVILAYWQRYCPAALASGDFETLARVHNGGPRGARKSATLIYWHKVRAATK